MVKEIIETLGNDQTFEITELWILLSYSLPYKDKYLSLLHLQVNLD